MVVNIEGSFEIPTDKDWELLDADCLNGLRIDGNRFKKYERSIIYSLIDEHIFGYNNKIADIEITYVLCKHYFDLGIPDDDLFSDEEDSERFQPEHYMRRYWFNYFAGKLYADSFGIWDSILELINKFYSLNFVSDLRLRKNVMDWLKLNQRPIYDVLSGMRNEPVYIEANCYRNQFVHGIAPSTVQNRVKFEADTSSQILDSEESRKQGKAVFKTVEHTTVVSIGRGDYVPVSKVLYAFEQFSILSSQKLNEIISLMVGDNDGGTES